MSIQGQAKVLSKNEFKRVESMILNKSQSKRNLAILYFSFQLGLRACEIRQLKIGDILDSNGELTDTINLTKTKGNKYRTIYLTNKKLREVLLDHINSMKEFLIKKKIVFSPNIPLFRSQKGSFFHPVQIVMLFNRFFKDAGIDKAKSHSGRRTFVTNKIEEGINIKSIATLVGHTSISMTAKYHDDNPNKLKKILEKGIF